jgi:hypothetical protein
MITEAVTWWLWILIGNECVRKPKVEGAVFLQLYFIIIFSINDMSSVLSFPLEIFCFALTFSVFNRIILRLIEILSRLKMHTNKADIYRDTYLQTSSLFPVPTVKQNNKWCNVLEEITTTNKIWTITHALFTT